MADTYQTEASGDYPSPVPVKIKVTDLGDGTFAKAGAAVGTVASGTADSGNPVKVGGVYNTTPAALSTGQRGDVQIDQNGNLRTRLVGTSSPGSDAFANASLVAVTSPNGSGGALLIVAGYVFNGTSWDRQSKATTTSRIPSAAATTNATSAKGAAGTVYSIDCINTSAAVKYLKLYNKASAPVVGTDTPVLTIALPPSNVVKTLPFHNGMYFSAGIAYALTGAAADADTTALAAGDVVGLNIAYS
jgi:hypothetical protein